MHTSDSVRFVGTTLVLALCGCGAGVASDATDTSRADKGSADAAPPPEENPIKLTLWPFWDLPVDANGFGTPTPLEGVEVCVAKKRRYAQGWDQFVNVNGPCTITKASEKVVLENVPAMSELILTAEKDGYVPRAIPVTTGQWDQDATVSLPDVYEMNMFSRTAASALFPGADLTGTGQIIVFATSAMFTGTVVLFFLGGVSVTLEPPTGDAPLYFHGGTFVPDATSTISGDNTALSQYSGAVITNIPQGEYEVDTSSPSSTIGGAQSVFGYASADLGVIRAPVLDGFVTEVASMGGCDVWADTTSCAPTSADAGAP